MTHILVCLLEEVSAKEMLQGILPRIAPQIDPKYITFQGKQDLEKNLEKRLRGWQQQDLSSFLILRDKDSADCKSVKKRLSDICQSSTKAQSIVRIACHELESFYLGDLHAVEQGLSLKGLAKQQNKKFCDPDKLANPYQELVKSPTIHIKKYQGQERLHPT
ncbi:MAG: hypothetical protein R2880_14755 [Deinococcales bacterium]